MTKENAALWASWIWVYMLTILARGAWILAGILIACAVTWFLSGLREKVLEAVKERKESEK